MLLAAGAGAGLAVAFNAPIAGAIFVLEELLGSFTIASTATTLGASASAICVSRVFATDVRGIDARLKEIEAFVLNGLERLQRRLAGEIPRAKAELAKHCTEVTLTPEGDSYKLTKLRAGFTG